MASFDSYIFEFLRLSKFDADNAPEIFIKLTRFITHLGDGDFLAVLSVTTLFTLCLQKRWQTSIFFTLIVTLSFLVSAGLKKLIGRSRPAEVFHLIEVSSPAFPSGHAFKSTVVYLSIYSLIANSKSLSSRQKARLRLLLFLPIAIGLSRIMLGVHWPTDVVFGWLLGLFVFFIFHHLNFSDGHKLQR